MYMREVFGGLGRHWFRLCFLLPIRYKKDCTWTNADLLITGHLGTNLIWIWIKKQIFPLKKMHLKMSSRKCQPFNSVPKMLSIWRTLKLMKAYSMIHVHPGQWCNIGYPCGTPLAFFLYYVHICWNIIGLVVDYGISNTIVLEIP